MKLRPHWPLQIPVALAMLAGVNIDCGTKSGGPSTSAVIGPAGGTLTMADGSSLVVPPGALPSPTTITMSAVTLPSAIVDSTTGPQVIGQAYQLSPEGLVFAMPATLTIALTPSQLGSYQTNQIEILTTAVGTTDHAYVLNSSTALDDGHVGAAITHFSWEWEAVVPKRGTVNRNVSVCTAGSGGATCVQILPSDKPCPPDPGSALTVVNAPPPCSSGSGGGSGGGSGASSGSGSSSGSGDGSGGAGYACGLGMSDGANTNDLCVCGPASGLNNFGGCLLFASNNPNSTGPATSCTGYACCVKAPLDNAGNTCCECLSSSTLQHLGTANTTCPEVIANNFPTTAMQVDSCTPTPP